MLKCRGRVWIRYCRYVSFFNLVYDPPSQTERFIVKDGMLTSGDTWIGMGQEDLQAAIGKIFNAACFCRRTVADFDLQIAFIGFPGDPVDGLYIKSISSALLLLLFVGDVDDIIIGIFFDYEPGSSPQAEAVALADCMEPESFVGTHFQSGLQLYDVAGLFAQVKFDKVAVVDLSKETNALAVFAILIGQVEFGRQLSDLIFLQMADRKKRISKLFLIQV